MVKIQSVLNFEKPRNLHAIRSLLGLANYFRGFVQNHSLTVKPLQDMIDHKGKKNSRLVWTQGSSDAFQAIRKAISHCPLMHFLDDTDAPIRLFMDASDYGIGGPNRRRHLAPNIVRQQVLQRHSISLVNDTEGGIRDFPLLPTNGHCPPRPGVHYTHRSPKFDVYEQ